MRPGDLKHLPWPALLVAPDGRVECTPEAVRLLGVTPADVAELERTFEVLLPPGIPAPPRSLPWRRPDPADEPQIWRRRRTASRLFLRVTVRPGPDGSLVALRADRAGGAEARARAFLRALNESIVGQDGTVMRREVLHSIVQMACEITDARYGAMGVLGPDGSLADFVHTGMSPEEAARVGPLPRGRGLLGAVVRERRTLRVARIGDDPRSTGFPPGHPPMTSFLGTPLVVDGRVFGNFYLTDKRSRDEFSEEDAERLERFARQAALTVSLSQRAETEQWRLFRALIVNAPYGIVFFPAGEGEPFGNATAERMLGSLARADGPGAYELVRPDGTAFRPQELPTAAALAGVTTLNLEALVARPGHVPLPVLVSAAPMTGETGRLLGAVVVYQDITPLKELERLRHEFTAVVVHDMRAPVQAVLLHAEMLLRRATGEAAWVPVAALQSIRRSGERLSRLVSDLLDASRLDSGRFSLHRQLVDLPAAVRGLAAQLDALLPERQVVVQTAPAPAVFVDPVRLDQVVTNLVENAAKYSEPGAPIHLAVTSEGGDAIVSVRDHGRGIPADELPLLFDRFYRARAERGAPTGLGLGLFIAKAIVEAHEGTLTVTSAPGHGSEFVIRLPPAAVAHPPGEAPDAGH